MTDILKKSNILRRTINNAITREIANYPYKRMASRRAHGIDFSKWALDWIMPEETPLPVDFAIQRLSYGSTKDQKYHNHSKRMNQVDIRGAYHYYEDEDPWLKQAELFLYLAMENPNTNYHMLWLDFESNTWENNHFNKRSSENCRKIIEYLASRFDGRVGLYANVNQIITDLDPHGSWMLDWPLWVAQLFFIESPLKSPSLKIGRTHAKRSDSAWDIFQYSWSGDAKAYGFVGKKAIDLNVANYTVAEFHKWCGVPYGQGVGERIHPR